MEGRLLLDVVVRKGSAILELLAGEDESLLVWGDTLLVLDLGLDVVDGVRRLHLQGDGFTRKAVCLAMLDQTDGVYSRFDENLHVCGLVYATAILEKLKNRKREMQDSSAEVRAAGIARFRPALSYRRKKLSRGTSISGEFQFRFDSCPPAIFGRSDVMSRAAALRGLSWLST